MVIGVSAACLRVFMPHGHCGPAQRSVRGHESAPGRRGPDDDGAEIGARGYLGFRAQSALIGGVAEAGGLGVVLRLLSVACVFVAMGAGALPEA